MGPGRRCGAGGGGVLEALILASLRAEHGTHGYDLRRDILEQTGGRVPVDVGGLYRTLRRLEDEGCVTSTWAETASGPQRRDYRITAAGRERADVWGQHLRERAELLGLVARVLEESEEAPGHAQRYGDEIDGEAGKR